MEASSVFPVCGGSIFWLALMEMDMKESDIDQWQLHCKNLMMVMYFNDAGLADPTYQFTDKFVEELN